MDSLDDFLLSHVLSLLDHISLSKAASVCKACARLMPIAKQQRMIRIYAARSSGGHGPATIAAAPRHTLCIREANGNVYAWGGDVNGDGSITPLAMGVEYGDIQSTPCPIAAGASELSVSPAREVAGGSYHSLFLSQSGQVFIAGSTLLSDDRIDESLHPVRMPNSVPIVQISCGAYHCLALAEGGVLLSWGRDSEKGRLGHGCPPRLFERRNANRLWDCNQQVTQPRPITALNGVRIQQASAGEDHSLCVSAAGELYSWGDPTFGRLGVPQDRRGPGNVSIEQHIQWERAIEKLCSEPRRVEESLQISHVSAGGRHSLAISKEGHLYAWGAAKCGQLGNGVVAANDADEFEDDEEEAHEEEAHEEWAPIRVEGLSDVVMAAAGNMHSVVLAAAGAVYTFGSNGDGQLCLGDRMPRSHPTLVTSLLASYGVALEVAAGESTTFVRFAHDGVLAAGSNVNGQLGCGGPVGYSDGERRSGAFIGRPIDNGPQHPHHRTTPAAVAWP